VYTAVTARAAPWSAVREDERVICQKKRTTTTATTPV
jgi:hypothetical protein